MTQAHHYLIVGAGLIGGALAQRLAARGEAVHMVSRSGTVVDGALALRLDAADAPALCQAAQGARTIYLCVNPPYHRWPTDWPPMFAAAIEAARRSGARLVIMGNLYAYGCPKGAMNEHSPCHPAETKGRVRLQGWQAALAAQERGEIRAVEVRASDFFGPGAGTNCHLGVNFFAPLLASRTAWVIGDPDAPHSWSFVPDVVSTLVAAGDCASDWGRVWHVPGNASLSRRQIAAQINQRYGRRGRVATPPALILRALGLFSPMLREVEAVSYQLRAPFVIDAAKTERLLGVHATPWDEALAPTVQAYLNRQGARRRV
jgi:nucleoside-diphosphate-sugar epimerase